MSFLGSIGKGLGHLAGQVGHVVSNPLVDAGLALIPGVGPAIGGLAGLAGKAGPAIQGVESFLTGNGGKNALGLAEAGNAAMLQSKQNDLAKQALGTAQQSYDERAPLRTAGIQGMMNPGAGIAPKIAALTANSSNPFQRSPAIQGVG